MNQTGINLIAGLGNAGEKYIETRHNVGFWFIEQLQQQHHLSFGIEKKFKAETAQFNHDGKLIRVIVPNNFMNLSGQSIAPMASFYRVAPAHILVIHDDLELDPGNIKLKLGGGHSGHNGLRDICSRLGSNDFVRLRVGIGRPNSAADVAGYVLKRPSRDEHSKIQSAIERGVDALPALLSGDYEQAKKLLDDV